MDVDEVLPFRLLSPANKQNVLNRNKFSKLSLKSHSKIDNRGNKNDKENMKLTVKEVAWRAHIADLLTSDESEPEGSFSTVGGYQRQGSAAGSTHFQESSTFSHPMAESTRYELENAAFHSQQTNEDCNTPQLFATDKGSSQLTPCSDWATAVQQTGNSDDSVVRISDSDDEASKKVTMKKAPKLVSHQSSVILISDESDCSSEPSPRYVFKTASTNQQIRSRKIVCDTVLVKNTDSDESSHESKSNDFEAVAVPPSVCDSSSSCSIISGSVCEDKYCKSVSKKNEMKNSSLSSMGSIVSNSVKSEAKAFKPAVGTSKYAKGNVPNEPASDESSWKSNLQLVSHEFFSNDSDQKNTTPEWLSERGRSGSVPSTLTEAKYQDIRRWLLKSRSSESDDSCEDKSCDSHSPGLNNESTRNDIFDSQSASSDGSSAIKHNHCKSHKILNKSSSSKSKSTPKRHSYVKKPSYKPFILDESEDNFEAFINSIKQMRTESSQKRTESSNNRPNSTKSFINDDSSVDDNDSPSLHRTAETSFKDTPINGILRMLTNTREDDCRKKLLFPVESDGSVSSQDNDNMKKFKSIRRRSIMISSSSSDSDSVIKSGVLKTGEKVASKKPNISKRKGIRQGITSSAPPGIPSKMPFKKPVLPSNLTPLATLNKASQVPYSPIRTFLSSLSGPPNDSSIRSHPAAIAYFQDFKKNKEELSRRLFGLYNREVFDSRLPRDMVVDWNTRMLRTAGFCYCRITHSAGKTTRSARIALSTKVVDSAGRLRDTLIHEMCHAAVWLLNNVKGGHGPFWKAWASKAMKRFPELPAITRCHDYKIETKFTYKCTGCGYRFGRHSKSLDIQRKRCGYCYGKFEILLTKNLFQGSKENAAPKTPKTDPKTQRAPPAFALFVKQNYAVVKNQYSHLKHGDVMKKLGEKFSEVKIKSTT